MSDNTSRNISSEGPQSSVSLFSLAVQVMIISASSFGGYTALISIVEKVIVEKKKWVTNDTLLTAVSVASVLPGPLAVNVVTYLGYYLKGWPGALLSLFAILSPSFLLMILAGWLISFYGSLEWFQSTIESIIPGIAAIVLMVAFGLFNKKLKMTWQKLLFAIALILFLFLGSYQVFIIGILCGGLVGLIKGGYDAHDGNSKNESSRRSSGYLYLGLFLFLALMAGTYLLLGDSNYRDLFQRFSEVSLSLFGGGYVMIPILQEIAVNQMKWVNEFDFALAISLGQLTPGPILISATYIGFKVAGIWGALLATIGIFLPSAVLMILISEALTFIYHNKYYQNFMQGVFAIIIAMITYSGWTLVVNTADLPQSILICLLSLFLLYRFKLNLFYLVGVLAALALLRYYLL